MTDPHGPVTAAIIAVTGILKDKLSASEAPIFVLQKKTQKNVPGSALLTPSESSHSVKLRMNWMFTQAKGISPEFFWGIRTL